MASLEVDINTHFKENKPILFSCFKFFSKKSLGLYLINEDYSFELWNLSLDRTFAFQSKIELLLISKNIDENKDFIVMEFLFCESLNKFLMVIKKKEGKMYLLILEHNKMDLNFVIEQRIYLLDAQKEMKDFEIISKTAILKFILIDNERSIHFIDIKNMFNYNKEETIYKLIYNVEDKSGGYKASKIDCIASKNKNDTFYIFAQYQKKDQKFFIKLTEIQILSEVHMEKHIHEFETSHVMNLIEFHKNEDKFLYITETNELRLFFLNNSNKPIRGSQKEKYIKAHWINNSEAIIAFTEKEIHFLDFSLMIFQSIPNMNLNSFCKFFSKCCSSIKKYDFTDYAYIYPPYMILINKYGILEIFFGLRFNNENILLNYLSEFKHDQALNFIKHSMLDVETFVIKSKIFIEFYQNYHISEIMEKTNDLEVRFCKMIKHFSETHHSLADILKNDLIYSVSNWINYLLYKNELKIAYELGLILDNEIIYKNLFEFLRNSNYPALASALKGKIKKTSISVLPVLPESKQNFIKNELNENQIKEAHKFYKQIFKIDLQEINEAQLLEIKGKNEEANEIYQKHGMKYGN